MSLARRAMETQAGSGRGACQHHRAMAAYPSPQSLLPRRVAACRDQNGPVRVPSRWSSRRFVGLPIVRDKTQALAAPEQERVSCPVALLRDFAIETPI